MSEKQLAITNLIESVTCATVKIAIEQDCLGLPARSVLLQAAKAGVMRAFEEVKA